MTEAIRVAQAGQANAYERLVKALASANAFPEQALMTLHHDLPRPTAGSMFRVN